MAFNWNVYEINGHSYNQIKNAFSKFNKSKNKPTLIISNTIKGKGISFMENDPSWHSKKINKDNFERAIKETQI